MQRIYYKKSLGQHFIKDPKLHDRIAERAGTLEGYNILEVGPGDGGLSKAILRKNPKKLVMIEKDSDLIPLLKNKFEVSENVEIIEGDAIEINIEKIITQPIKIIANLPYNVATQMILDWLEKGNFFTSITVLIQKEVADRFLATIDDDSYGRTAILTNLVAEVTKDFDVPPGAFTPPPKVNSTLITFKPFENIADDISWENLAKITRIAFSQPRKTIYNNLRQVYQNAENILNLSCIEKNRRAESLSLQDFVTIYKNL